MLWAGTDLLTELVKKKLHSEEGDETGVKSTP